MKITYFINVRSKVCESMSLTQFIECTRNGTWQRITEEYRQALADGNEQRATRLKGNLPAFKAARKVDDYTVDIEMTHPYPLMLNDLTNIFIFNRQWLVDNNSLKPTDAAKSERVSASAQYSKVKSAMPINGMMPKPWSTPFTTP